MGESGKLGRRPAPWLFLAAVVTGCAIGPTHRVPEIPVSPAFREAFDSIVPAAAPRTAFWEALGDTTLSRLVAEALRGGPDVQAAAARVRGARAARLETALDFAPTITAVGGYTRQRLAAASFPGFGDEFPDQDVWSVGIEGAWELDVFGRIRRNVQGRTALVASAEADFRDVQVLLAAELASAYYDLRGAQDQLAVARRNAENQRRTLEVTQERLDAGRGTAFDTERAQAQLSSTLAAIPVLQARVAAAQYRIGVLVGRAPAAVAAELERVDALPPLPDSIAVPSPDSLVRARPDVVSAERQLAASTAFVGAAQAEYLPRVDIVGAAGYTAPDLDAVGRTGTSRYAVGPVISWPALNLGRVKARADQARAREAEARARYQQTVLLALQEVETSLAGYRAAREELARLEDAAAASERAANLARLRFESGAADFLEVLDAERTLLEAQDRLARSRAAATNAFVAVYRALGGTWPVPDATAAR